MDYVDLEGTHKPPSPPHRSCRHHHHPHPPPPHHHHHHHHFSYISPHCPRHSYLLQQKNHSQSFPFFNSRSSPQNQITESFAFVPSQTHWNLEVAESNETHNNSLMTQEEIKQPEPEEEEEPVFVLTDEWKEFFAKSEAKRRLAKQQAKKKGKT